MVDQQKELLDLIDSAAVLGASVSDGWCPLGDVTRQAVELAHAAVQLAQKSHDADIERETDELVGEGVGG
jgi:hypothetical protein